jgi:hypothetical protein
MKRYDFRRIIHGCHKDLEKKGYKNAATTKLVLHTITTFMDMNCGNSFPGAKLIAEESSLSIRAVFKHLKIAEEAALIVRSQTKASNRYSIHPRFLSNAPVENKHAPRAYSAAFLYALCAYGPMHHVHTPMHHVHTIITPNKTKLKKLYKKDDLVIEEKDKGLAEFCSVYNSARDSKAVKQAYKEAIEGGTCHETIVKGAKAYLSLCRAENREERFIKKPAKWLLDECWKDHIKPQIKLVKKTRVLNFGEESNGIKDPTGLHHGIGKKTPSQRAELYAWYVRVHTSCAPQQHHISYLKSWETHHGRVELKQTRSRAA